MDKEFDFFIGKSRSKNMHFGRKKFDYLQIIEIQVCKKIDPAISVEQMIFFL